MGIFGTTMVCIAEWLLFIFPLYQAYLELDEQRDLLLANIDLMKFIITHSQIVKYIYVI
ncbi:Uncharacterised protein [Weissella viridescens]|uniref:Uncharacterized protein n=1 Tax=Weissella viridescens TaxID=1629 RepID=A0A380NY32_WEIVI|nr:Uncharacterised protein [Weissella viridescens]